MKKFLVIYHAPQSFLDGMANATPEDHQKGMEPWMAWAARCGSSLVDMGAPLVGGQKLSQSGSSASDKQVVGYSILQAEDMAGISVRGVLGVGFRWREVNELQDRHQPGQSLLL
jgi:hypothetical protein